MSLKLLAWNDRDLSGKGFINWTPFQHPQLGLVEIGGWDAKFCMQNPPPGLLLSECHKNALWIIKHASSLPEIHITETKVEVVDENTRKVSVLVDNYSYLPTYLTNKGKDIGAVRKDVAELIPGDGVTVVGKAKQEVDFLEGYLNGHRDRPARSSVRVSWVVKLEAGVKVDIEELAEQRNASGQGQSCQKEEPAPVRECTVEFRSQRGGTARKKVELA